MMRIKYKSPVNSKFYAPLIDMIKTQLEILTQVVDFEKEGEKVEIDGFRLKNLPQWRIHRSNLQGNIGSLSSYCNCDCIFCYEKGNVLPFTKNKILRSVEEVKTRIKYYDNDKKMGLVPEINQELESFTNPYWFKIFDLLRSHINSDETFFFTTNGSFLTIDTINKLKSLMPLIVVISINSQDPEIRQQLMRDKRDITTGIKAIKLLKENGIPFYGSIVAWPTIPIDDIRKTIEYLSENDAYAIRVDLPGYTKYFSNKKLFNTREWWDKVVACCKDERKKISSALYWIPSLYGNKSIVASIDGVIKNSPAYFSGLKSGDVILKIDNHPIYSRAQAQNILRKAKNKTSIVVNRNRKILAFTLRESYHYPYILKGTNQRFGIHLISDLKISYLEDLKKIIESSNAHKILFFTSEVMKPHAERIINMIPYFKEFFNNIDFHLEVAGHYFWGGNILINDIHVVEDFILSTKKFIERKKIKPDLIVIPSSFTLGCGGFDLKGTSYKKIERELEIPVKLLKCTTIM